MTQPQDSTREEVLNALNTIVNYTRPRDRTRDEVVDVVSKIVDVLGWRVRKDDEFQIVLLPPLARRNPARNRWPNEPEEGPEDQARSVRNLDHREHGEREES